MFDKYLPILDETADKFLGNTWRFSANGGLDWNDIQAYLQTQADPDTDEFAALDPLNGSYRVKVAKRLIAVPDPVRHRFKHPVTGSDAYRPENWRESEGGRYWMIDLQKA